MKRFQNNVICPNIAKAIKESEILLDPDSMMMKNIRKKDDFKYKSGSGEEVYIKLRQQRDLVPVFTYRPWWAWSKALGYYDGKAIHINILKLENLDHAQLVGLLCHEYAHHCGFKHGTNLKTKNKVLYSVPYFISQNIKKWT